MSIKIKDQHKRFIFGTGVGYLLLLVAAVVYGLIKYQGLPSYYADTLQRTEYHQFLRIAGPALALYLSIWAATFGLLQKSFLHGLGALASGGIITIAGLSILPWLYYPNDQYAIPALWVIGTGIPIVVVWALVTLLGRVWINKNISKAIV